MRKTQGRDPLDMDTAKSTTGWLDRIGMSPLLWGGMLTLGFYQLIPYLPAHRELAQRYFCSHPLEYAIAGLFFLGIAILALKMVRLATEKSALAAGRLRGLDLSPEDDAKKAADRLEVHLTTLPSAWRGTHLVRRISEACAYVRNRRSAEGLEEHLKYLADQSYDRAHESFGLVRTINWAVPIIGFLGTVVGITLAIANVTPEQLDSSLGAVTGGLAVAFDTTALSLSLTLVLVFFYFIVERSEQQILARVEDFGCRRLACLFPVSSQEKSSTTGTLADVQMAASQKLLEKTEAMIEWQTELWQNSLESMRTRWMATMADQQARLSASLEEGMAATFSSHAEQLAEIRDGFAAAFQQISQHIQQHLAKGQAHQNENMQNLIAGLSETTSNWQNQMCLATAAMNEQVVELRSQKDMLLKVVAGEEELARLQQRLTENLDAVRTAEAFEETLHSLSAAVHLLTARNRPNAA